MKIKYEELNEKRKLLLHLLTNEDEKEMTKLKYAILKWNKGVSKILSELQNAVSEEYNEKKEELEIFHAIEKDGILLKKDDKFQYSKENLISLSKELSKIKKELEKELANKEIEFEPYILTDSETIAKLDDFTKEELKNIFI
jgi:hypothetical protein